MVLEPFDGRTDMSQTTIIEPSAWRHYKGNVYTVLGVASLHVGPDLDWGNFWPNMQCDIYSIEEDPSIHIYGQAIGGKLWYRPILGTEDYGDRVLYFDGAGHWARTVDSFFGLNSEGQPRFTELLP